MDNKHFLLPQLTHNSASSKAITVSIACFIAKDLQPYSVVEWWLLWHGKYIRAEGSDTKHTVFDKQMRASVVYRSKEWS